LEGGIDGLVHLSDISWNLPGEEAVHDYKKNQEVEAVVLAVDPERERISLGIKQMDKDPFSHFLADNPKGSVVKGTIISVDAKGAVLDLGGGVEGMLRSSEIARERIEDARSALNVGDEVEAKFIAVDRKNRTITLSIKAKEVAEEAEVLQDYSRKSTTGTTTLGDILKEQLGSNDE
jgi:small subunit ribosomal protein S1